jgi:ankyrin repeat protein
MTGLLTAYEIDNVVDFGEFLKHRACVVVAIKKGSELLKAAAEKGHVDVVRELLEIGASVKMSKKYS